MPIRVLLDTSILMISLELPFDLFGEIEKLLKANIEFLVLQEVQEELQRLSQKKTPTGVRASHALEVAAKHKTLQIVSASDTRTDDALIIASREVKAIVATADSQLRRRLRTLRVPVLSLRGNRLYCEPDIAEYWPLRSQKTPFSRKDI